MVRGDNNGWQRLLDAAVFGAGALLLALETLPMLSAVGNLAGSPRDTALLDVVLLSRIVLIALAARAAARGATRPALVVAQVAALAGLAAAEAIMWPPTTRSLESEVMIPLWALQALQLVWLASARTRVGVLAMAPGSAALFVLLDLPDLPDHTQAFNLLHSTLTSLAVAALVAYLRRGAAYSQDLDRRALEARAATARGAGADRAAAEASRLLHDEAITALRAIAQGPPGVPVDRLCATALARMEERSRPTDTSDLLERLVAESPVDVRVVGSPWPDDPPGRVLDSFGIAAAEALRNVHRHSGAAQADVRISAGGATRVLEVVDRGRGSTGAPGFGLLSSVTRTMETVGGTASVTGTPGGGTTVRLSWSPEPAPALPERSPLAATHRFAGYQLAVAPIAVGHLVASWFETTQSRPASVAVGLLIAATVVGAALRYARRQATWVDTIGLTVVVCTLTAIGLRNVPEGGLMTLASWPVDFAALLIVLAAFEAPARRILPPVAAQVAVVAWAAALDPQVGVTDPFGAYFAAVVPVGFAYAVGGLIRAGALRVLAGQATLTALVDEQAWRQAERDARERLRAELDADVAPVLRSVAAGRPVDDALRAEAASLAARVRDTLYLQQPPPADLSRAIDAARRRGVTVGFRGPADGAPSSDALTLLTPLARHVLPLPRVEVATFFTGEDPRLVVVPALPIRQGERVAAATGTAVTPSTMSTTFRPPRER